jgi:hypothetical protein
VISANAADGITVTGAGASGNRLSNNEIGVGVGGQPLGNVNFGILIINGAPGTVIVGNINLNNGLGPVRDTNAAPATNSTAAVSTSSKKSTHKKKVVKVEHAKAKPAGPKASHVKTKASHGESHPKKK